MSLPITNIVLGAGGLSGVSYLGVLRYFQEQGFMNKIKHCYGVSIGAFFAFLFASKIDVSDIEVVLKEAYCFQENTKCSFDNIASIQSDYGLDSGDRLVKPIKKLYQSHYSSHFPSKSYDTDSITFIEFAKHSGCTLTVVATNVDTRSPVFFSVDTTPNLCIWKAIQASMTIPGIFKPVEIDGNYYVDGYLTCEYPAPVLLDKSSTLGFFITTMYSNKTKNSAKINSFIDYLMRIMETMLFYPKETYRIEKILEHKILLDECPIEFLPIEMEINGFYFKVSEMDVDVSIGYGYEKAYTFFTELNILLSKKELALT